MNHTYTLRNTHHGQLFESTRSIQIQPIEINGYVHLSGIIHSMYADCPFELYYFNHIFYSNSIDLTNHILHFPCGLPISPEYGATTTHGVDVTIHYELCVLDLEIVSGMCIQTPCGPKPICA